LDSLMEHSIDLTSGPPPPKYSNAAKLPLVNISVGSRVRIGGESPGDGLPAVESRCGAVAVGPVCLLPPLSSGGARVTSP
jgi:hypothetical protein